MQLTELHMTESFMVTFRPNCASLPQVTTTATEKAVTIDRPGMHGTMYNHSNNTIDKEFRNRKKLG